MEKIITADENLAPDKKPTNRKAIVDKIIKYKYFYLMFLPIFALIFMFKYLPMLGIKIAFYEYGVFGPTEFIGLDNFRRLLTGNKFLLAFSNTLLLSGYNLVIGMFLNVLFALLLNEMIHIKFKKIAQTVMYLPHFLSWVVVASIFTMILSPNDGMVNIVLQHFGIKPIYFLASESWWRPIFVFINAWRDTGYGTIIFLAALASIDQEQYEAAEIDGAGKLKQTWYITLPALQNTILVVFILNLSKILNIFESVLTLYNPMVYSVSDVIGTYVYRVGLVESDYGFSTAVGLFKSAIAMVLVLGANKLSKKIKGKGLL